MRGVNIPILRGLRVPAVAAALLLAPSTHALAWGNEGHQVIAAIAYARLTPAVRKKVSAMLAADKDPLSAPDFASRATWADKFRDSDRDTSKVHYRATHNWHFVNIEIGAADVDAACNQHPPLPDGTPASEGPPNDCVVDKIEQFVAELGDAHTAKEEKLLALKYLLHFIGDVHQPLHAAEHEHDRGGNTVPVMYAKRTTPDNLHAYWDTHLVEQLGRHPAFVAAALDKQTSAAKAARWSKGSARTWAMESFAQAKDVAYNFSGQTGFSDDHGGVGERLDLAYEQRALAAVREQLSKAGVRLAWTLNTALK